MKYEYKIDSIIRLSKRGFAILIMSVVFGVFAVVSVPLLLVWKEAEITSVSAKRNLLLEKKSSIEKELATLTFKAKRLSSIERIEYVARNSLDLEYPESSRIRIIRKQTNIKSDSFLEKIPVWVVVRRSMYPEGKI